jgi:hypothetical protein
MNITQDENLGVKDSLQNAGVPIAVLRLRFAEKLARCTPASPPPVTSKLMLQQSPRYCLACNSRV